MDSRTRRLRIFLKTFLIALLVVLYMLAPQTDIPYLPILILVAFFVTLFAIRTR